MSSIIRQSIHTQQINSTSSPNRSVSPIHYVKPSSVYYSSIISPSKSSININKKSVSVVQNVSPINQNNSVVTQQEEVNLWKSRCNELETSLCQINTDFELASFKAKKAKDLEGRVDDILKQNSQLLGENDALSKQFSDKRKESDIWRTKYELQVNNINTLKSNYESEIQRLLGDLNNHKQRSELQQMQKSQESSETKEQLLNDKLSQIEQLKRTHVSNVNLYEEQLRKMIDAVNERERELELLQSKLTESRNYGESESNRLNEEKERLRAKIAQMDLDQAKELENLKRRAESLTLEQISALKKLHESELDVLEGELNKLKNLIDIKNNDIQVLIQQNKNQKKNFENEILVVRDENGALKDKILENNRIKEDEINDLQNKLANLHTTDISDLKSKHDNQVNTHLSENNELQKIIQNKLDEIRNQQREKQQQRSAFDAEVDRLKSELETQKLKYSILERDRQKEYEENQSALNRANISHAEFAEQQRNQVAFLQSEIEKLKQLLVFKNNEIDTNISQHRSTKKNLEDDVRMLRNDCQDLRKKLEIIENQKNQQLDELRNKVLYLDKANLEKTKKFESQIDYLENELKKTRENLQVKTEESSNHQVHRSLLESETNKLNNEVNNLKDNLIQNQRAKTSEIQNLKSKLENSSNYTIENIKSSHANQTDALIGEIEDLKAVIDLKDRELQEKADHYQQIEKSIVVSNGGFNEYQQKVQKLGAEGTTSKNIYEVFVKSRQLSSSGVIMPNNSGVSPIKRVSDFQ